MSAIGTSEYIKIRRYVMNPNLHAGKVPVQIPTINELSEKFGVSRPTVSKAMKELNIPLEINLLGMSEGRQYPNEQFWKLAGENGNQVILGLDAHSAMQMKNVNCYNKAMEMVEKYNLNLIKRIDIKNAE